MIKGQRLGVIDHWLPLICSADLLQKANLEKSGNHEWFSWKIYQKILKPYIKMDKKIMFDYTEIEKIYNTNTNSKIREGDPHFWNMDKQGSHGKIAKKKWG